MACCFSGFKNTEKPSSLDPWIPRLSMIPAPSIEYKFRVLIDGYEDRTMHLVRISNMHTAIKWKCKVHLNDDRNIGHKPHGSWCFGRDGALWVKWSYRGALGTPRWHGYVKLQDYLGHPDVVKQEVHCGTESVK